MEHVLLKFGLCLMILIDDGNEFRCDFETYYCSKQPQGDWGGTAPQVIELRSENISRGTRDVGTIYGTVYAWNASPLGMTNIMRSVPAIGRTLRFPLDINLTDMISLIDNPTDSVATYLRYLQHDVSFSQQLLT